jgi:hypothetical protein
VTPKKQKAPGLADCYVFRQQTKCQWALSPSARGNPLETLIIAGGGSSILSFPCVLWHRDTSVGGALA